MLDRDARPLLDRVAGHDSGVVGGTAREDHDAAQLAELVVAQLEPFEHDSAVPHPIADRLGNGLGLLVDLLQHERLVALLLGGLVVPVHLGLEPLDLSARAVEEACAGRRDLDDLAVLDQLHATRLAQECGDRRGEEGLAVAEADEERALETGPDEDAGMVGVDDDDRKMALEVPVRRAHGLGQVAGIVALDEMGDHLSVGLGRERVAVGLEALAQLAEVLDDAVQDDGDLLVAAGERMRVLDADAPVRRPARVADSRGGRRPVRADRLLELHEVTGGARVVRPGLLQEADAGRVVAAVLEALEALDQEILGRPPADVSDDPAHLSPPSRSLTHYPNPRAVTPVFPKGHDSACRGRTAW